MIVLGTTSSHGGGTALTKAERKAVLTQPAATHGLRPRLAAKGALRILVFVAYAAVGWGLLALIWFGLIA